MSKRITPAKVTLGTLAGLVIVSATALVGFNIYIRVAYGPFYDEATREFAIPGNNSGFVVQDIAYAEDADMWIFSGYVDGKPSPIWRLDGAAATSVASSTAFKSASTEIFVTLPDGSLYNGHGGGISLWGDYAYLTCENGYIVLDRSAVLSCEDGGSVQALGVVDVGFTPAFLNVQDGVMYTGVYYYAGPYNTPESMHIVTPDGTTNHAIMYAYDAASDGMWGFAESPRAVYSIPDKVQGVCITSKGDFVFSTSWGASASVLPRYRGVLAECGRFDVNGEMVPLFCFDGRNYLDEVVAPPMSEGIILHEGRIFIPNEAASNKYVFGKLYGAGYVYSIAM